MAHGTCLAIHGGRLVVVKQAGPGPSAARLRHEAACLGRHVHPGVVELVAADDLDDGGAVLRTAFVGGGTLAEWTSEGLDPAQATRVAASLAATLADLHQQGTTHGRVTADHVLTTADGGALLCGFAEATVGADPEARRPAAAVDVAAVGTLIRELSGDAPAPGAVALSAVASRALAEDPSARPSMRSLAVILQGLVDDAGAGRPGPSQEGRQLLPRRASAQRSAPGARPRRQVTVAVVGGIAVLAMAMAVGVGAMTSSPEGAGESKDHLPLLAVGDTTTPEATTEPSEEIVRVWPPPACGVPPDEVGADEVGADIDGDGCVEEIEVGDGVVRAGQRRWEVGGPRDVVVVGDWDCDDVATPAVLRPGSGEVWHYPRWAGEGEEIVPALVTTVPGAVDAAVEQAGGDRAGCDQLSVLDTAGTRTTIDTGTGTG